MSSLGCVMRFSRYLLMKLVISALTVGIFRSVCKIVFGTHHHEEDARSNNPQESSFHLITLM